MLDNSNLLAFWGADLLLFLFSSVMNFAFSQRSRVLSRCSRQLVISSLCLHQDWLWRCFSGDPVLLVCHSDCLFWSPEWTQGSDCFPHRMSVQTHLRFLQLKHSSFISMSAYKYSINGETVASVWTFIVLFFSSGWRLLMRYFISGVGKVTDDNASLVHVFKTIV